MPASTSSNITPPTHALTAPSRSNPGGSTAPVTYDYGPPVSAGPGNIPRKGSLFSRWLLTHRSVRYVVDKFEIKHAMPRAADNNPYAGSAKPVIQVALTSHSVLDGTRPLHTAKDGELTDAKLTDLIKFLPDATPAQLQQLAESLPKLGADTVLKHDGFLFNLSIRLLETNPKLLDHVITAHDYGNKQEHANLLRNLLNELMTHAPDADSLSAGLRETLVRLQGDLPAGGMPPDSPQRDTRLGRQNERLPHIIAVAMARAATTSDFTRGAIDILLDHAKHSQTIDLLVDKTLAPWIRNTSTPTEKRDLALSVSMDYLAKAIQENIQIGAPAAWRHALSLHANTLMDAWIRSPGIADDPNNASTTFTEALTDWTLIMVMAKSDHQGHLDGKEYPPRLLADLHWDSKKLLAQLNAGGYPHPGDQLTTMQIGLVAFSSGTDPLREPEAWNSYFDALLGALGNGYTMGEWARNADGTLKRASRGNPIPVLTSRDFMILEQIGYLLLAGHPQVVEHCAPARIDALMQKLCATRYETRHAGPNVSTIWEKLERDAVFKGILPAVAKMQPRPRDKVLLALLGGQNGSNQGSVRHIQVSGVVRGLVKVVAQFVARQRPESLTTLHALYAAAREASMLPANIDAAGQLIATLSTIAEDPAVKSFLLLNNISGHGTDPDHDLLSMQTTVGLDDVVRYVAGKNTDFENVKPKVIDRIFKPENIVQVKEHLRALVPANIDAVLAALQLVAPEATLKDLLKSLPLDDLRPQNLSGAQLVPYLQSLQGNANLPDNTDELPPIRTLDDFTPAPAPGSGTPAAFEKAGLLPKNMQRALLVLKAFQKNDAHITAEGFLWSLDLQKLGKTAVMPAITPSGIGATSTEPVYEYTTAAARAVGRQPAVNPTRPPVNVIDVAGFGARNAKAMSGIDATGGITAQHIVGYLRALDPERYADTDALYQSMNTARNSIPRNLERVMDVVKLIAPGTSVQDLWDHVSSDMLGSTLMDGDHVKGALALTGGYAGSFGALRNTLLERIDGKLKDKLGEAYDATPQEALQARRERALLASFEDARLLPKNFEVAVDKVKSLEPRAGKLDLLFSLDWSKLNAGKRLTAEDLQSCLVGIDAAKHGDQATLDALASGLAAQQRPRNQSRRATRFQQTLNSNNK